MRGCETCYGHSPSHAAERSRNASRGGRSGGRGRGAGGELAELQRDIRGVIDSVLDGTLKTSQGAVALQGHNTLLRSVEIQRRTADLSELLERLSELEATADRLKGVS